MSQSTTVYRTTSSVVTLFFLWGLFASTPHAQNIQLPEIGQPSGTVMTPVEEQRLGEAFMRAVRASGKVVDDPLMSEYIQTLGSRLSSHQEALGTTFRFFLIDDSSINAFAGPAGHIGVHTGLILNTETESELASVLAHEISHVTQKHLMRAFDEAGGSSMMMAAALLAAILIGSATKNTDATMAAITATQAVAVQKRINFTRSNEKEADNVGIRILSDSGYDPNGMPDFFERMGQSTRYYDLDKVPEFLLTHPVTSNRIAESRGRASEYPYRQVVDSMEYHLLRSMLRLRDFSDPAVGLKYFEDGLKEGRFRNQAAQRYGYALALLNTHQYSKAGEQLDQLLKESGFHPAFIIAKARVLREQGKGDQAVTLLEDGAAMHGTSRPLLIARAETLLELGRTVEIEKLLEERVRDGSSDARLYQLLAQAAGANGHTSLGHLYIAEYHYHSGATKEAKHQLEIALRDRDADYFQRARISARLKEIDREISEKKERKEGDEK